MDFEAENQGNAEMFFKTWNGALSENLDVKAKSTSLIQLEFYLVNVDVTGRHLRSYMAKNLLKGVTPVNSISSKV